RGAEGIGVIPPLREGVIADLDAASAMLQAFLRLARLRRSLLRPAAVVCVPSGTTWVERRALAAAAEAGRPRCLVQLGDEPIAAAAGAGVDPVGGTGAFIADVGGGTTEVAGGARGRPGRGDGLRLGGNAMDDAIVAAIKAERGLLIGRNAARRLKIALGLTGGPGGTPEWAEAVGVDVVRGIPRAERIPGELISGALEPCVTTIIDGVREIL